MIAAIYREADGELAEQSGNSMVGSWSRLATARPVRFHLKSWLTRDHQCPTPTLLRKYISTLLPNLLQHRHSLKNGLPRSIHLEFRYGSRRGASNSSVCGHTLISRSKVGATTAID